MSNKTILGIVAAGAFLTLGGTVASCASYHNTANRLENSVRAQASQNQNAYDSFWKSIVEMSQVNDAYKEDFKAVLMGGMEARYGKSGSQAVMQWIQEQNPSLDPTVYTKLQTAIEAGRTRFANEQELLLDKQRSYRDHLGSVSGGIWAGFTGHPREVMGPTAPTTDLDGDGKITVLDYPIVTSARTASAFSTGQDDAIQLRTSKG